MRLSTFLAVSLCLCCTTVAAAATFPDVPTDYLYRGEIGELSDKGIITGNSDGTFRPSHPINRAAFLVLLYRAAKKLPSPPERICMKDVIAGAWYEAAVCHAITQRYVKGYDDGTFRPEQTVTRAEALKMILTVMEFDLSISDLGTYAPPSFTDVRDADWFSSHVTFAYAKRILPINGWNNAALLPGSPLSRGEAAALISNAMHAIVVDRELRPGSSSSSSVASGAPSVSSRPRVSESSSSARIIGVTLPVTDIQTFLKKQPFTYRFSLKETTTVDILASLRSGQAGGITARLFRLESSGLSSEYYIGFSEKTTSRLLVTVPAGDYQIDLQPTAAENTSFSISVKVGKGDANDGFAQAKSLDRSPTHVDVLEANDFADYYAFSVGQKTTRLTVSAIVQKGADCFIYGLANVDFFGESFPVCNEAYDYPPGSYIVAVTRDATEVTAPERITYTVKISK